MYPVDAKGMPACRLQMGSGPDTETLAPVVKSGVPFRRGLTDQSGFTLVELLVAMPIALIVVFAVLLVLDTAVPSELRTRERAQALRDQEVGLERMTRELREATSFTFLTSQKVEFDLHIRSAGGLRKIQYDCSSGDHCLRLEGPVGGPLSATGTRIVDALVNPDVFEPEPDFVNPRYVGVVARVRLSDGRRPITLRDGVDLRNLTSRF
jgi:prepilin-type N-terminal cleavage/methylation domain-containing protein